MNVIVLTDNEFLYRNFKELIKEKKFDNVKFDFFFSESNKIFRQKYLNPEFNPVNLKQGFKAIIENYKLVLSLHCKQRFPAELVNNVRCVNVHPGYNPYNRGWFPQVFSIMNKLPAGVTIHEIDDQLDHGPIIVQKKVDIFSWETSFDVYKKIQEVEIELLGENLRDIIENRYKAKLPTLEGNLNLKKDFIELCKIDLNKSFTFREAIDYFRSMSFSEYKNAYFYDEEGPKIYVDINLHLEK